MPESRTGAAVGGDRRWRALLASLAVVLAVASVPVAAWAIPAQLPATQGEEDAENSAAGEIIADGRTRLPNGDIAWTIRQIDVPAGDGITVEEFPVGFALVDQGTVTLREEADEEDEDGPEEPTELGEGEADVLPSGNAGTLTSGEGDAASLYEIALVSARGVAEETGSDAETGTVVGEPFPAPEGQRFEFALVRNTLSGDGEATIPVSGSGAPVLYLTTEGTAQLQAGDQMVDLAAGQFALLTGEVQVRAAADEPATFVVAAIGEEAEERERGAREGRENRAERQREPRERAGGGGGGGGQSRADRQARRAARQAARAARQAQQGQGGRGGGRGQTQQPGTGAPGGGPVTGGVEATATVPAPVGTPGVEPTPEPTLPAVPTVPTDGTPPPVETPPVETPPVETPPVETPPVDETAVPTATVPVVETPTPEPTIPVVPTNPPVPEVPGVPGVPTVPAEETVVTESLLPPVEELVPVATLPVEEAPAAPIEEEQTIEPTPEG